MRKNTPILILTTLMAGLLLSACQQRVDLTPQAPERTQASTESNFLQMATLPPVLMQYSVFDGKTNQLTGFLIDHTGEIRTFTINQPSYEWMNQELAFLEQSSLRRLHEQSRGTGTYVDRGELERYFRGMNRRNHLYREHRSDRPAETIEGFHLYGWETTQADDASCGSGRPGASEQSVTGHNQIPLQITGEKVIIHTDPLSTSLVDWLRDQAPEDLNL